MEKLLVRVWGLKLVNKNLMNVSCEPSDDGACGPWYACSPWDYCNPDVGCEPD